jgi:hypothetical protein
VAANERPSPGTLARQVGRAVDLTVEAGSARMQHGSRVGAPDGPLPPRRRPSDGWIDLRRRRAWFPDVQILGGEEVSAEQFWVGPTLYVRFSADEPWADSPLIRRSEVPETFVPYSSPWWLLDALCGVRDDAQIVDHEEVRGTATTRIRVSVDSTGVVACSPQGLRLPGTLRTRSPRRCGSTAKVACGGWAARGQCVARSDQARASPIGSPPSCGTSGRPSTHRRGAVAGAPRRLARLRERDFDRWLRPRRKPRRRRQPDQRLPLRTGCRFNPSVVCSAVVMERSW